MSGRGKTVFEKCYDALWNDVSLDSKGLERITGHTQNTISSVLSVGGMSIRKIRREIYRARLEEIADLKSQLSAINKS